MIFINKCLNFTSTYCVKTLFKHSVNFNKEKALIEAFSWNCETSRRFFDSSSRCTAATMCLCNVRRVTESGRVFAAQEAQLEPRTWNQQQNRRIFSHFCIISQRKGLGDCGHSVHHF